MTNVIFNPDTDISTRKGSPEEIFFKRIREVVELVDPMLDVKITSGVNGPLGRTGSPRHNSGFTADFKLIRDGKVVPVGDPLHLAVFSRLPSVGFNELGVDPTDEFIHAGFKSGDPGAWGYRYECGLDKNGKRVRKQKNSYEYLNADSPDYVKALQRALGIEETGIYGADTQRALAKVDFMKPSHGTAVDPVMKGHIGGPPPDNESLMPAPIPKANPFVWPNADLSEGSMAAELERSLGGSGKQPGIGPAARRDPVHDAIDDALLAAATASHAARSSLQSNSPDAENNAVPLPGEARPTGQGSLGSITGAAIPHAAALGEAGFDPVTGMNIAAKGDRLAGPVNRAAKGDRLAPATPSSSAPTLSTSPMPPAEPDIPVPRPNPLHQAPSTKPRAELKYYRPILLPNPRANRRYKSAAHDSVSGKPTSSAARDIGEVRESIMTAALKIIDDKRSQRGRKWSWLDLAAQGKPTFPRG